MKKKTILFLVMLLLLSCTACASNETAQETATETVQEVVEETVVEIVQPKMDITDISATEKEIYFYRDDLKIYAKMYMPEGEGPFPVVIFSHGFPGTHFLLFLGDNERKSLLF